MASWLLDPDLLEGPVLRYKDVCKRDMKTGNINLANWEATAADRSSWRLAVKAGIQNKRAEERGTAGGEETA